MSRSSILLALVAVLAAPALVEAQEVTGRAAGIRIGGRLHSQYAASSVASADNDFFFRRVRLIADITFNDFVSARVQPDFAGGKTALQDTYVTLSFSDGFELSMGQFKRAFDLFELDSSTDLSLIERDGRIAGVGGCAGVGGACSFSRLSEKLEYAGRDQGIRIEGSNGTVEYMATMTNGTGINVSDENDAKSYSARVAVAASDAVSIGFGGAIHDYVRPDDENGYAAAWSADLQYGTWRDGLLFQFAAIRGDNWKVLDAQSNEAPFTTVQGMLSYFHPMSAARVSGIEPLLRVSVADPDGDTADDGATIITPGFMVYLGGKNKIGVNLDVFSPQSGDTEYGFKIQSFLYF